jgi:hypothetical protein
MYASIDLDLKRKAFSRVEPPRGSRQSVTDGKSSQYACPPALTLSE